MHSEGFGAVPLISLSWNYLMILITLVVLFLILRKFFWTKVKTFMEDRQNEIKNEYDSIDSKLKESEELRKSYEVKLDEIDNTRRDIIKKAKKDGEQKASDIINQAYEKSENIVRDAERRAKRELDKAEEQMKNEIATLAIIASEKILKQTLTESQKEKYLDKIRF